MDSKDSIAALDRRDMLGAIEQMPSHLSEGFRLGLESGAPPSRPPIVAVCGIGGSAMGGHLLEEWLSSESAVPCTVCSSYSLPKSIGKGSLVIVASYSGDTEETLSMFREARKRGSRIVAIASGGRLAKQCASGRVPLVKVPRGLVPRASLGFMFGGMLGILEGSRIASARAQTTEAAEVLSRTASYCRQSVPTKDNPAKIMAHELFPRVPVIVGYELTRPVAKRWANQLCENSKVTAFSSELPEMDHNEIVGWMRDGRARNFAAVFLDHKSDNSLIRRRVKTTKEMLSRSTQVLSVEAIGKGPVARMLSLVMMGDYVSTYLSFLRKEDPSTNEPIDELKRLLAKK